MLYRKCNLVDASGTFQLVLHHLIASQAHMQGVVQAFVKVVLLWAQVQRWCMLTEQLSVTSILHSMLRILCISAVMIDCTLFGLPPGSQGTSPNLGNMMLGEYCFVASSRP